PHALAHTTDVGDSIDRSQRDLANPDPELCADADAHCRARPDALESPQVAEQRRQARKTWDAPPRRNSSSVPAPVRTPQKTTPILTAASASHRVSPTAAARLRFAPLRSSEMAKTSGAGFEVAMSSLSTIRKSSGRAPMTRKLAA